MSSFNKLVKNTAIFGISNFSSKLLVFLLLPFYTRILSTSEFGVGDLVVSIVSLLLPIVTLSVSEGALRFAMSKTSNKKSVFSYGLFVIFIGFVILLLFFPIFKNITFISNYVVLFYLLILSSALNSYFNNFLRGINNIKLIGFVGVSSTLVLVLSNILFLVVFEFGVNGYLLAQLVMNISSCSILFVVGKLYNFISFRRPEKELVREINEFNIPLIPNRISWILIATFNKYSISYFIGTSAVGIFSAANRIPSIITALYGIVQQALLLVVIEEYEDGEKSEVFEKSYYFLEVVLLVSVMVVNILLLPLAEIIFSEAYYEAYRYAQIMVLSAYFGSLHGNLTTIFTATKETKILFQNSIIGLILTVCLNIILVPTYGIYGASLASLLVYFVMWLRLFMISKANIGLTSNFFKDFVCYALVLIQSLISLIWANSIYYIISLILFMCVLIIKKNEIAKLFNLFKKSIMKQ